MKLVVIGRNPQEANIVLNSQYISNYHAEIIQLDNGDMFLVDKSTNGTYLNGTKLTPGKEVAIKRGDNISFADTPLDWSLIDEIRLPKDVKQLKGIGSHYMNAINVQGPNVSRFHATVRQMADGKWYISDHSKNGTTVNGVRIQKNRYVRIKKSDEITCAGVPIQNPIPGPDFDFKWLAAGLVTVACVVLAVILGSNIFKQKWPVTKIADTYNPSTAIMMTQYHFEVSCPGLNLQRLGIPTEFYIESDDDFYIFDGKKYMETCATGFFIGNGDYLVTNRHVARPWEADAYSTSSGPISVIERAEIVYRRILANRYHSQMPSILPYISQIKVKGVVDKTVVIPNGEYPVSTNIIACSEFACSPEEQDLAIFTIMTKIPESVTPVPIEKIKADEVSLGDKIYTIGFPFGFMLQDTKNRLQANFASGDVSRQNDQYKFGFTAPSNHGASGSPLFDAYGNLVGVVNSGLDFSQGYNYAIKAKCLLDLLKQNNIVE